MPLNWNFPAKIGPKTGKQVINMQLFGAGRVPPQVIAAVLARLDARYGQFAVLGNHDYLYGARKLAGALRAHAITVLDDESRSVKVKNHSIDLVGIPNARVESARSKQLLAGLVPERPSIVLTHDPMWFANVPRGPHLTLAGHTH